ncbi:MAG: tetratricopeptide repeat-containing glycosyltransferase family 2 protein [Clostridium sp.]
MSATLSVSIIAKNEEHNLRRCINSIKNIADEIILVDTGSTDNTISLAESLGAKVYKITWNKNFSEAKNTALDKCTMDWILVIDCDEAIDKIAAPSIKEIIQNSSYEGYYLKLINLIGDVNINETSTLRIFRNNPNYRFESKLHEQIYPSIIKNSTNNKNLVVTDIPLYHYGYDHNVVDMSKKIKRNIEVLESFSHEEKDGFFYYSLGNEYSKLNDNEKAKECFLLAESTPGHDYGYYPYLSVNLIKILASTGDPRSGLDYANKFIKSMEDYRDIYFVKAMCEHALGLYKDSYNSLLKFKTSPKIPDKYPSFNFEADNDIDGLLYSLYSLSFSY